ncbi:MAG: ABC transporter permease [Caldilineaceae bacterium]|nr:ABC transporter permease [Caldilineaceae bacterium]
MSLDATTDRARVTIQQNPKKQTAEIQRAAQSMQWVRAYSGPLSIASGFVLFIILWALIVKLGQYPPFILPAPDVVLRKFISTLSQGTLIRHAWVTLSELMLGLLLGLTSAFLLGYLLGKNPRAERIIAPFIVASQSVPIVAIAPLLLIWFGSGLLSKVLVCALITFFPTLVNTIVGIRNVDTDLRDLMRSLRASRWQLFRLLDLPAAAPTIFGGLKLSVILSVVGAVVGEFVGADAGLGFLINLARGVLDTPLMFVAIISLIVLAQTLYMAVSALEAYYLRWQKNES